MLVGMINETSGKSDLLTLNWHEETCESRVVNNCNRGYLLDAQLVGGSKSPPPILAAAREGAKPSSFCRFCITSVSHNV